MSPVLSGVEGPCVRAVRGLTMVEVMVASVVLSIIMVTAMGLLLVAGWIFFLARLGLVTARKLIKWFRWAVLAIFVAAAIITPTPDVATQTVFAVPMILLYLLGVVVAALFGKKAEAE